MQVQRVQSNNYNANFGIKLNINSDDLTRYPRLGNIQKQFEKVTKKYPKDSLDFNEVFFEYFKNGSSKSLVIQSEYVHSLSKLLKENDDTVLKKLLKIAEISRKAYKLEADTEKCINDKNIVKIINDSIKNSSDGIYRSIGEIFAYKNLKNDEVLSPIVYYTRFFNK